jgi:hypothetical protein
VNPAWIVPSSNIELGRIYYGKGQYELAEQALRRVLDGEDYHDSHDKARELLDQIKERRK